jgi:hypothetical protein
VTSEHEGAFVLCPHKDTQSQIARKVNFAIQLPRETTELLETSSKTTFSAKRSRYPRPQNVGPRDE